MDMVGGIRKTVCIGAVQFFDTDACLDELIELGLDPIKIDYKSKQLIIQTPNGEARANQGDYVLKDINGMFYSCTQDVFEQSYDDYGAQEGRG